MNFKSGNQLPVFIRAVASHRPIHDERVHHINIGDSLKATGELTRPAMVSASTKSRTANGRKFAFLYTVSWNSLNDFWVTQKLNQQVPLFVEVRVSF